MERKTGLVQFFNAPLGFGFIKPDDGADKDIFCHFTEIQMKGYRAMNKGDRVSYEIGENHKGPMAIKIIVEAKADEQN